MWTAHGETISSSRSPLKRSRRATTDAESCADSIANIRRIDSLRPNSRPRASSLPTRPGPDQLKHICVIRVGFVESINLGAVLFGILLLLWLVYALPRTASRREVMGRTRAADETEMTAQARDLSAAVHSRRTTTEGNSPMSQDRLLRPADPTRRPRFDAEPGTRIDPVRERNRSRRLLAVVLVALALVTLGLTALAVTGLVDWWAPLLGLAGI